MLAYGSATEPRDFASCAPGTQVALAGGMRWVGLMLAGLAVSGIDGCFILRCDDTFHGVSDGDRFSTTIIGPYTARQESSTESCGNLGDLTEGTTLRWTAHPDGPGDGCDDEVEAEAVEVSSAVVSGSTITMENGCQGTWSFVVRAVGSETDLMTTRDPEKPTWYLERTFSATTPQECFPDGEARGLCRDAFVATSKRD